MQVNECNYKEMADQWDLLFGGDLPDTQMVKLTYNFYSTEYGEKILKTSVPEVHIHTKQGMFDFFDGKLIDPKYGKPIKPIGGSINAGIYKYDKLHPRKKCNTSNYIGTKSIVLDIDAYVAPEGMELSVTSENKNTETFSRLSLAELPIDTYNAHGLLIDAELSGDVGSIIGESTIGSKVIATGGGLSVTYQFEKLLGLDATKKIYSIFSDIMLRKYPDFNPKRTLRKDFLDTDGNRFFKCKTNEPKLPHIYYKLDKSAFSVFQTQRILGSVRPNYNDFVTRTIDVPALLSAGSSDDSVLGKTVSTVRKYYETTGTSMTNSLELETESSRYVRMYSGTERISNASNSGTSVHLAIAGIPKIDKDLASTIYENNPINILENILELDVELASDGFTTFLDPIRQEGNASISLKHSDGKLLVSDFYDNKYYGFMEYIVHINKLKGNPTYSYSNALDEISRFIPNIKTDKTLSKSISDMYEQGAISEIVEFLNSEKEYVYYRNASDKRRVYRLNILSGDVAMFDGVEMFVATMLRNKLKLPTGDEDFEKLLKTALVDEVIKVGHEKYEPGGLPHFTEDGLLFINTWISTDTYRAVVENIEEFKKDTDEFNKDNPNHKKRVKFDINTSLDMFSDQCPMSFMMLNQITQEGSLPWLVKWLSAISNFEVVPTLPVIFGEYGAGKNIFLERMINVYFGEPNTEAIQADRLASGFNAMLGNKNLIALDEGDSSAKGIYETIKALTGSQTIMIEKKGVDAVAQKRHANFMLFNNNSIPLQHEASDRRAVYFKLKETLTQTLHSMGIDFEEFSKRLESEQIAFWTIIKNTKYSTNDVFGSLHDKGYYRQILLMHPFGQLLVAMVESRLNQIFLDTLGQETNRAQYTEKTERLKDIANLFNDNKPIPLLSINNYTRMAAAVNSSFKRAGSLSSFVFSNGLDKIGITINNNLEKSSEEGGNDEMFTVSIDKDLIKMAISPTNNLYQWHPNYFENGVTTSFGASSKKETEYEYKPLGVKTNVQYETEAKMLLLSELGPEFDLMKPRQKKQLILAKVKEIKQSDSMVGDFSEAEVFCDDI